MSLTSKERVRRALNHKEPDRVPIDCGGEISGICYKAYDNLIQKLGIKSEGRKWADIITGTVDIPEKVLKKFHVDTRYIWQKFANDHDPQWRGDNSFVDEWGIRYIKPENCYYFEFENHPFEKATINDLKKWNWPEPKAKGRTKGLKEKAQKICDNGYAVFTVVPGTFELSQYLRGMEKLFMDFYDNPKFLNTFFDKVTEILIGLNDSLLDEVGQYLDCILYYSDLATQKSTFIRPELWRELVKPREAEIVKAIKRKTNAKVAFHTDGSIIDHMTDFIEMGIDVLNPIQRRAHNMDIVKLKQEYGDTISFWGGIDQQYVLPKGSSEEVREEVRENICALGKGGGYILSSCHNIQNDVPPENIIALFEEAYSFGKYPLRCD